MNRPIVLAEWKRAVQSLGAAQSCRRDGFYVDSVSLAYYAILHAARGALQVRDIAAESHAAVKRLFGLHLVKACVVEPEWGSIPGESLDLRLTADYDVETQFCDTHAREQCDRARSFLVRIRKLLLSAGLTAEEVRAEVLDG